MNRDRNLRYVYILCIMYMYMYMYMYVHVHLFLFLVQMMYCTCVYVDGISLLQEEQQKCDALEMELEGARSDFRVSGSTHTPHSMYMHVTYSCRNNTYSVFVSSYVECYTYHLPHMLVVGRPSVLAWHRYTHHVNVSILYGCACVKV